jgi:hypothetical protein
MVRALLTKEYISCCCEENMIDLGGRSCNRKLNLDQIVGTSSEGQQSRIHLLCLVAASGGGDAAIMLRDLRDTSSLHIGLCM